MRKNIVFIFALLFTFCFSNSAKTQEKIAFKAKWVKGKTYTYLLFHNKYNPNNTEYKRNNDTSIVNYKVVSTNPTGTVLSMKYYFSKYNKSLFKEESLKKIIKEVKQTPIELQLDSNGKFQSIKNWNELKSRCLASINNGKSKAPKNDKDIWEYWKTKVNTEEQIEKLFINDIEFFFMLFGSDLVKNKAFNYVDEMTYNKQVLPANTRLIVKEDSLDKTVVMVELFTLPDADKADAQLNQYRKMAKEQEDNPDVMPEKAMFDLQDFYRYSYNTTNNTLNTSTYLRYTRNGTKELVEEIFFKVSP